jgi:AhpD family alkylhydroperoxidase
VEKYVRDCGLERGLLELVKLRASQINGCAYCVDMHTKHARANGETEQRLYAVVVWREAPFFTERERAALAWTEAVTLVSREQVPENIFEFRAQGVQRQGTGRSNDGRDCHQRMEPPGHQFSRGGRDLSA